MVNIIVVEDEDKMQKTIKEIVLKVIFPLSILISLKMYKKYDKELEAIINDKSMKKIYILDIELEGSISGIKIAEKIRKEDWESEIIFLSNHDKMKDEVFGTLHKIFSFIPKFHNLEEELSSNLKKILEYGYDNEMFEYNNRKISLRIYYKDITYIVRDKNERKLTINTTKNKFVIKLSLEETLRRLDKRFKIVHRSCIANTMRVAKYNWTEGSFIIDTGEKVPILSKKYRSEVTKTFQKNKIDKLDTIYCRLNTVINDEKFNFSEEEKKELVRLILSSHNDLEELKKLFGSNQKYKAISKALMTDDQIKISAN